VDIWHTSLWIHAENSVEEDKDMIFPNIAVTDVKIVKDTDRGG